MKNLFLSFVLFVCFNVNSAERCLDKASFPNVDILIDTISNNIDDEAFIQEYISHVSEAEQKVIFINLSSNNRAKLWLAHLNNKLNVASLNYAQKEVFSEIISFAQDSSHFENDSFHTEFEKINYLYNRVNKFFPREEAIKYFSRLSYTVKDIGIAAPLTTCACNKSVDFCYVYGDCRSSGCAGSSLGCGLLWLGSCNGLCSHMMEP